MDLLSTSEAGEKHAGRAVLSQACHGTSDASGSRQAESVQVVTMVGRERAKFSHNLIHIYSIPGNQMTFPASRQPATGHQRYALVIFDMDGTLTEELLDFAAIRAEMGLPEKAPILEHMAALPVNERARAEEILHRHEMRAAAECILHEGAAEVLAELKARGVATALLTRNSTACASNVLSRHKLVLDVVATREHVPHKPHGDAILNIVRRLGILAEQTLMVGDYLYDVQTARNASVDCALFCRPGALPEYAGLATYTIRRLREVLSLVDGRQIGRADEVRS